MRSETVQPNQISNKPVLAIDFDDTLVTHAHNIVATYNETHSGKIRIEDTYVAEKLGDPESGWNQDRQEALKWIGEYLHTEKALHTPPVEGAKEALDELKQTYQLTIVTGREPEWDRPTHEWLDRFLPNMFDEVHFAGSTRKSLICKEIGANIIVDDSPVYVADCVAAGMDAIVFGDYPWNHTDRLPKGVKRAKNWKEVVELLSLVVER